MMNGDLWTGTTYQLSELVVDLSERELVRGKITGLGLKIEPPAANERHESEVLNLALLRLGNLATPEITARLEEAVAREAQSGNPTQAGKAPTGGPEVNLDRVLYCLRRMIGAEREGAFPSMGKNRDVVVGQPHLSGTANQYPVPEHRPIDATPDGVVSANAVVGVLDTKIFDHPDLRGHFDASATTTLTLDELTNPRHYLGHATFVTGLIRRHAPNARVLVRSVLSDDRAIATAWNVALEMAEFKGSGVEILCLALGTFTGDNEAPLVLARAVEVLAPEMVIAAAAGNRVSETDTRPMWPAALPVVVAIGAVDGNGRPARFSPAMRWVNGTAPGVDVVSTYLPGKVDIVKGEVTETVDFTEAYAGWSGTSFALAIFVGRWANGDRARS